jgi:hypothetical protein
MYTYLSGHLQPVADKNWSINTPVPFSSLEEGSNLRYSLHHFPAISSGEMKWFTSIMWPKCLTWLLAPEDQGVKQSNGKEDLFSDLQNKINTNIKWSGESTVIVELSYKIQGKGSFQVHTTFKFYLEALVVFIFLVYVFRDSFFFCFPSWNLFSKTYHYVFLLYFFIFSTFLI